MELSGKWIIKEVLKFNDNYEREWVSAEAMLADEAVDPSDKKLLSSSAVFDDDGFIKLMMPLPEEIPQEELKELLDSGEIEMYGDDMIVYEKHPYKLVDGKLMFDTGTKGEVLGEAIDPWAQIKEADGMLEFMSYHLAKA